MGKETLKSRERVKRALEHREIDRFPIDFGMSTCTGISAFAYYNLRKYMGLPIDNITIADTVQILARVDDDLRERFHSDTKFLWPPLKNRLLWNPRDEYKFYVPAAMNPVLESDGSWVVQNKDGRMRMPKDGFFFDGSWLRIIETDYDIYLSDVYKEAEIIYKDSDYFCCFTNFNAFFGDIDFACDMITDPEKIKDSNEKLLKHNIELAKSIIKNAGEYIGALNLNSDLGTQSGPMCNPVLYEELCLPYYKKFCDFVHENSDIKIFMHSCGAVEPFIPYFIEAGVDALNPVQISANNMEPENLKKKYGDKITFWGGGCNTQVILPFGSIEEIKADVRKNCGIFKEGSGFVFCPVHNIMGNISPEKIIAMLDTAYECSFYT